ncbi:alpha/beta fold hydrolase [Allorhizobium sp. BGMRC 0089]|uniref:thioesterase domain-containing protein n=1 Tax=Allorhizobium sonneratiae TaxID=2934936 RepID=UPI00203489EE|nr:thioesterase domain-containing protein [Allorhizobium sonneratiae]MCM2291422.1 alpha/beta fold hydrolase [Allorhizobium sonneratiae]
MTLAGQVQMACEQVLRRHVLPQRALIAQGLTINRALKLIRILHAETGIELNVNSFYLWPSMEQLVAAMDSGTCHETPKLIPLRNSESTEPALILFAGGLSCFLEMQDVIDHLTYTGPILGMALTDFDRHHSAPARVSDEIAACRDVLRQLPHPPFGVIGYSFGGVFALELARSLAEGGTPVKFLAMIDTPQSEHSWPFSVWLGFMAKRLRRRLSASSPPGKTADKTETPTCLEQPITTRDKAQTISRTASLLRPLLLRFKTPTCADYPEATPQWAGGYPPDYDRAARQLLRMKGLYRPRRYDAPLTFYRAKGGSPVDCDPALIWPRSLPKAEWIEMNGNHQSLMVGRHARMLAEDINQRIERLSEGV